MKKILLLFLVLFAQFALAQTAVKREVVGRDVGQLKGMKVSIRIIDEISGESLVGATVTVPELNLNRITDNNGTVELNLDRAEYNLELRYVGYETVNYPITAVGDARLTVRMIQEDFQLDGIVIFGSDPEKNIKSTDMGAVKMNTNSIKELPPFLGEVDIIRSMATLPGVSQVGEAAAGLNVRGGGADQNLIQFAGAPIYNPTHLFGLFTSFNPDVVNDFTLYKSVIPTRFGGRGSSILDISPKAGSVSNWGGDLMVSNVSGKVGINGPIMKDKVSIKAGFRGSYINWFLGALSNPDLKNSQANFYDGNLIINAPISENNEFTYSFYTSYDDFAFASDTTVSWKNTSQSLQWKSRLSEKLNLDVLGYYTQYDYSIFNRSGTNDFDLNSGIQDFGLKVFLTYQLSEANKITFGGDWKSLTIQPGELIPGGGEESGILPKKIQDEYARESGVHFQHEFELGEKFGMTYGARYDMYQYLGARKVNQYEPNRPFSEGTSTSSTEYGDGDNIMSFNGFGPRGSLRYSLSKSSSFKAGYNKMYQFIHLISNTATIAPTDVWKLSDQYIEPQIVDQYSLGFYNNFKGNIFETSIEVYYKDVD